MVALRLVPPILLAVSAEAQQGVETPTTSPSAPPIGLVPANRSLPAGSAASGGNGAASIFLSGRIAMENGASQPSSMATERVCSISARTVAWTDPKGRFSFWWGSSSSGPLDASDSGNRNSAGIVAISPGVAVPGGNGGSGPMSAVMNCELRGSLAGYRSDVINLTSRHETDSPDVGLIVLHRLSAGEGATVTSTSLEPVSFPHAPAAAELRNYLQFAPNAPDVGQVKAQLDEIESIELEARGDKK